MLKTECATLMTALEACVEHMEHSTPQGQQAWQGAVASLRDGRSRLPVDPRTSQPHPIDMCQELRRALGMFDGAMPCTPETAWVEAIARVEQTRANARAPRNFPPLDPLDAATVRQASLALVLAYLELNSIRARDGVPYTSNGWKADVTEEHFSSVGDAVDAAVIALTGRTAHCHPLLYAKDAA